ncbi:MAG: sulfite oxidase [Myxococcales bacterium]|nr:sulfite oxidase [Myxococcales bacterium]
MSEQNHTSSGQENSLNKQSPPTRRGVINMMSAGAGLILGAQVTCSRESGLKLGESLSPALAETNPEQANKVSNPRVKLDLNVNDFIIHGERPLTYEAKRHTIGTSLITHEKHLYIPNNLPMPDRAITDQPDEWLLDVKGVKNSRTISIAGFKTLGLHTVTAVLQCSGNGRTFYTHSPSGSQWATGAAGCVVWSGIKLIDVVKYLGGLKGEPKYVTGTGGDPLPNKVEPAAVVVERSIPIEKGLKDAMLAWEMNGDAISLEHGGPLRLIVPGYFGCNQIKYIKRLAFTAEQTQSKIQKAGYRFRPIGEKGSPHYPSMWSMPVKSWLTNEDQMFGDQQVLRGVAMGGERSVERVEVSVNGGKSWKNASLVGPDLGRFAWRLFQITVNFPQGKHKLMSRAYDDQGKVQAKKRQENERGYGHSGWLDHALDIEVYPKEMRGNTIIKSVDFITKPNTKHKEKLKLSTLAQRGKEVYLKETMPECGICHALEDAQSKGAIGPKLDKLKPSLKQIKNAVSKGLGAMPPQKQLNEQQLNALAQYIFEVTK